MVGPRGRTPPPSAPGHGSPRPHRRISAPPTPRPPSDIRLHPPAAPPSPCGDTALPPRPPAPLRTAPHPRAVTSWGGGAKRARPGPELPPARRNRRSRTKAELARTRVPPVRGLPRGSPLANCTLFNYPLPQPLLRWGEWGTAGPSLSPLLGPCSHPSRFIPEEKVVLDQNFGDG